MTPREAVDLMVAAGHLPWAWIQAGDQGSDPGPLNEMCCQPGCSEAIVSVYRIKHRYCNQGHKDDPLGFDVRGFCRKHLRRGDCGLSDADANYEVVSGPGPDGHEPSSDVVSKSRLVVLDSELST